VLDPDFSVFPLLVTPRLTLRQVTMADAETLHRLRSDERAMRYIGRPRSRAITDGEALVQRLEDERSRNESIGWAIERHETPGLIGTIGFYRLKKEHHRGEVGYVLDPDHWGKGFMQEALDAVIRCGFERFDFHSIEANTDPRNTPSRALLERCGFVLEGLFKENYYYQGAYMDTAAYSLLRSKVRP
jgi:[ribosomal protein S5]-alanine N-acetyltransferase